MHVERRHAVVVLVEGDRLVTSSVHCRALPEVALSCYT